MKKSFILIFFILMTMLFLPVNAYSKDLAMEYDVPNNKVWNITFKEAVDFSSLKNNIIITTGAETVPIDITIGEDKKTVMITPQKNYTSGDVIYTLIVKRSVKSITGHYLDQEYTKKFKIKMEPLSAQSSAFTTGGIIPPKYGYQCGPGYLNQSIPVQWSNAPQGTKSFALFMYDLDPIASNFVHWAVVNIPADTTELGEGASCTSAMPAGCTELMNDFGSVGYGGPCPPFGSHEYKIILYALDTESISLSGYTSLGDFTNALSGHILQQAEITGNFAH